jgi:hypothetical protein
MFCSLSALKSAFSEKQQSEAPAIEEDGEEAEATGAGEAAAQQFDLTRDPATGQIPVERLVKVKELRDGIIKARRLNPLAPVDGITWLERGPNNVGGRSRVAWFDLNDAANGYKKVWAAGVGGGLWYTNDITVPSPVWVKINDFFDNIAVSCFAQDPSNPQVMYFGTGEGWFNFDAIAGLGIWKSTNGGTTWTKLASTDRFVYVQDIVVNSSGHVYAAVRPRITGDASGIQRSVDGGVNWTQVLGSPVQGNSSRGADLEIASNGDMYATIGHGSDGRIFRSANNTFGSNTGNTGSWDDITPDPSLNSFPASTAAALYERIEVAVAPSNPNIVIALFEGTGSNDVSYIKTFNPSVSAWFDKPVPTIIDQGSNSKFTRGQAWYDLIAAIDPNNANRIWIGGVDGLRSDNQASTWDQKTTWSLFGASAYGNAQNVHADHHEYKYAPGSSSRMLMATDGGMDYSENADFGGIGEFPSFERKNNGYNVTQFYSVANHPTDANYFIGGTQDNGTHRFNVAGMNNTTRVVGGDGGFCHIDQNEPNIQIASTTRNNYNVSTNGGNSFSSRPKNNNGGFINPTDYDDYSNILYCGNTTGTYLRYISPATDGATTSVSVTGMTGSVTHVMVSPSVANRVYFGTSNGLVVRVNDAHTGTSRTGQVIFSQGVAGSVSCVAVDPANEDHLLVTFSNYGVNSIWESQNGGTSWTSVEGNFPDMPVRWAIFDPRFSDWAILATEMGVWSTNNLDGANTQWNPTNSGLANTRVDMLQYSPQTRVLSAATHGRGLFTAVIPTRAGVEINFPYSKALLNEATASTADCRKYTDYTIPLQITSAPTGSALVSVAVQAGGTAYQGADYDFTTNGNFADPSNLVVFENGSAATKNITLRIYDDAELDAGETFTITYTLSGSTNAVKGAGPQTVSVQIGDNDSDPVPPGSTVATIGTNDLSYFQPFRSNFTDAKTQMLYTAAEMRNAGLAAGNITRIGFEVVSKGSLGQYESITIKMGNTVLQNLNNAGLQDGLQTVYTTTFFIASSGINDFTLQTPFSWDGNSNVIVEFCFDNEVTNPSGGGGTDNVKTTLTGTSNDANPQIMAIWKRENNTSCDGLNTTGSLFNGAGSSPTQYYRPVIRMAGASASGIAIATAQNNESNVYIGPVSDTYVYNSNGNQILARIKNLTSFNYGCTNVKIDRAGQSAKPFMNNSVADYIADKAIILTPSNSNANGQLEVTLYYTNGEINGWQTVTGRNLGVVQMVKTKNAVSGYTQGAVQPSVVEVNISPASGFYGSDRTLKGTFRTGTGGFGIGTFYSTTVFNFIGNGNWSNPANWQSGVVPPNTVSSGFTININPVEGGEAVLDIPLNILPGAVINIANGKKLRVN